MWVFNVFRYLCFLAGIPLLQGPCYAFIESLGDGDPNSEPPPCFYE